MLNFDKNSFKWLAENYIRKRGLRSLTWAIIIKGIRNEHLYEIKRQGQYSESDANHVLIVWNIILKFGGITDHNKFP